MSLLDENFWKRFAKTTWEKKSVTFKNVHSPLLQMDQDVIFELLVTYSNRCRRTKNADGMKFYIYGQRQFETEVLRHLPKKSDRDLAGYHARMSAQYEDYCLVCDELLQVDHDRMAILTDFLSDLFAHVGFPNRFAEMGLYLGNYRKTPFGVHEDSCGVFSFPIVGKKKFRIWQPSFVKNNPKLSGAFSYAKFKDASQVLTAEVGDMSYWPSTAWHIAESDGSFSATWSLGVWVDKKHSDVVSQVTGELFEKLLGAGGESRMASVDSDSALRPTTGEIKALPKSYRETLRLLKALSSSELDSAFREAWLTHVSKNGLKSFPPGDLELTASTMIRLRFPNRPILWMKDGPHTLYAFNGKLVRSGSKALFKLVSELNENRAAKVSGHAGSLQPLADAGAFKVNAVRIRRRV